MKSLLKTGKKRTQKDDVAVETGEDVDVSLGGLAAELLVPVAVADARCGHVDAVGRDLAEVDEAVDQRLAHLAGADDADLRALQVDHLGALPARGRALLL